MFGFSTYAQAPYASLGSSAYAASVAEGAAAYDSVFVGVEFTGQIFESVAGADVYTSANAYFSFVLETATALDTASSIAAFAASVNEAAAGSDSFLGAYLWNVINDSQTANWQNINDAQTPGWQTINDAQTTNWSVIKTKP